MKNILSIAVIVLLCWSFSYLGASFYSATFDIKEFTTEVRHSALGIGCATGIFISFVYVVIESER